MNRPNLSKVHRLDTALYQQKWPGFDYGKRMPLLLEKIHIEVFEIKGHHVHNFLSSSSEKNDIIYRERKSDNINVAKWQHLENRGEEVRESLLFLQLFSGSGFTSK